MYNGLILDSGYVVYIPEKNAYFTSNVGVFKTKRNAQKACDRYKRWYTGICEVVKVNIVISDD